MDLLTCLGIRYFTQRSPGGLVHIGNRFYVYDAMRAKTCIVFEA